MTLPNYRAFVARLRAAGWRSLGHGCYRHESGAKFYCFDGVVVDGRPMERWQALAQNDEMPSTTPPLSGSAR